MKRYYLAFEDKYKHIYQEYPMFSMYLANLYFDRFVEKLGNKGTIESFGDGGKEYTQGHKKMSLFVLDDLTDDFYDRELDWFLED